MIQINRFKVLFVLWGVLLAWCVIVSTNVYLNMFLICVGFIAVICAGAYVAEHANNKEQKYMKKLRTIFNNSLNDF